MWNQFENVRSKLNLDDNPSFEPGTGISDRDELIDKLEEFTESIKDESHPLIKAKAIAFILDNAAIEVNPLDWFGWNFCGWLTPKKVKAGPTKTMAPRDPSTVKVTELTEPEGIEDNLDPVYRQLVDAIEGAELKIKPEQTLRVVKVMEAAFESHEKKQVIHLDI